MYQTSFTRSENNKPACNKPKKFHLLVSKKNYMTHIRSYAESRPKWNFRDYLKALKTENFEFCIMEVLTFGMLLIQLQHFFVYDLLFF